MSKGFLQISTYNQSVARPISEARVQIFQSGNLSKVIEELSTDISGRSVQVELPAPPQEYSMEPNQPQPYSLYDINITADGFEDAQVLGVQVLPDETSLQDVILYPGEAMPKDSITIPPNTLYGEYPPKTPESNIKELPNASGFVVLPEPVIPEYIVVHAGRPTDSSAPDYWVPFKDYIKNVACCEIYSTWPVETLRANVLAIISLTLNRVYTEWYRNRGYGFTITNSTSFDQAFTYGRNIFSEINTVVDDIFINYVTKPNIDQPLFTQYCDGKNVSCPGWMTQWGSKSLGDKGYTAVNILKSYYGWDIYLAQAKQVEGVPSSFDGTPIRFGDRGAAVRTVQQQINAISNNFPAIKKIAVDGDFGTDTKKVVEQFQSIFHLPVTGIVDRATWYKISEIYVAVTKIAEGM